MGHIGGVKVGEPRPELPAEIERRRRLELDLPDPVPHPDDIVLDVRNGTVSTEDPLDEREKAVWDQFLVRRAEAQEEVSYFADRYRRAIEQETWPSAVGKVITASFGIADISVLPGTQGVDDLIAAADSALYKAKLNGRNRVEAANINQSTG